jgi:hypothetical protein
MNGNTPYAGLPGITDAGKRAAEDVPDLSDDEKQALRDAVSGIAARTREFLPDEFVVNSNIKQGVGGPRAMVAVRPPVGQPVSAGFTPDMDELTADSPIATEEREEVAQGLAASAAFQVKQSMGDDITPTAR